MVLERIVFHARAQSSLTSDKARLLHHTALALLFAPLFAIL